MRIDHVTVAGPDLEPLAGAFRAAGLPPEFGGVHSNGITQMALAGFDDGSYLELIATVRPGQTAPWWPVHIREAAGPCAWAIRSQDIETDAAVLESRGIPVRRPVKMRRTLPDHRETEFSVAFPGPGEPGTLLPFLVQDHTDRSIRARPSPGVGGTELTGVRQVLLAVPDLAAAVSMFRQAYGWPPPVPVASGEWPAHMAHFTGTPVVLAEPDGGWLADRLERLGASPAAFVFGSRDLGVTGRRLQATRPGTWLGHDALWFDPAVLCGALVGITQT